MDMDRLLAGKRRRARLVLWTERLVPALALPLGLLAVPAALGLAGVWRLLPAVAGTVMLVGCVLGALALAAARLVRTARPDGAEIDARLERASGEVHRPLLVLADRPSQGGSEAVWQAHRAWALARVRALRAGWPTVRIAEGTVLAGVLALMVAGMVAGPAVRGRILAAFTPRFAPEAGAAAVLSAWVVPPARTNLSPIFLDAADAAVRVVPVGSRITLTLQGGIRVPSLTYAGQRAMFRQLDRTGFQADLALGDGGTLEVWRHARRIARFRLAARADQPPVIAFTGPARTVQERVVLQWAASDDYGLAQIGVTIRRAAGPTGAVPLGIQLEGTPRLAHGGALPSLVASSWAGLPVAVRLFAVDTAGQRSQSGEQVVTLPTHAFHDPLAGALDQVRLGLARGMAPGKAGDALDQLSDMAAARLPAGQFLNLRAVASLLAGQGAGAAEAEAEQRLWQLAMAIEDGGLQSARARLAAAREAMHRALAQAPSPARTKALEQATQELQAAVEQAMQALAAQAAHQQRDASQTADGRQIDPAEVRQMTKDMADAAKAGRTDEAAAALDRLTDLLDHLRPGSRSGQGGKQAASPEQQALQKLLRDQSALAGHAERRLSDTEDPRTSSLPDHDPDEAAGQPDPAAQRGQDAAAQEGLRKALGDLAQKLGDATGQVPEGLAKADTAMQQAMGALQRGDDKAAAKAQGEAMAGLAQGGQQGKQGEGQGQGKGKGQGQGQDEAGGGNGKGTDPLGRPVAQGAGGTDQNDVDAALNGDPARGRAVRDELRRRASDRTRPAAELDYIDRLLQVH